MARVTPLPYDPIADAKSQGVTAVARVVPTEDLLPASYCSNEGLCLLPANGMQAFLEHDLDTQRLNDVHHHLWMAGKPRPARSLCKQVEIGRRIVVTNQTDIHLLWTENQIFMKPLPQYLINAQFWAVNIIRDNAVYRRALGFLLSYVWLIAYESDFHIAQQAHLLPPSVTWSEWARLVRTILARDISTLVDERYHYGELRLGRVNAIYRFVPGVRGRSLMRHYYGGYSEYSVFFRRNFAWLVAVFATLSIVLAAMQVGLGVEQLAENASFQDVCTVITVLALVVPCALVAGGSILFGVLFCYHFASTVRYHKRKNDMNLAGKV